MTIFLRKICVNFAQIFVCKLLPFVHEAQFKFYACLRIFLRNSRKTGSIAQKVNFIQNVFLHIDQNCQFQHRIKQLKVYSKTYLQINYHSDALNWLLLVTKPSNWGIEKLIKHKLEIWNLIFQMLTTSSR